MLPSRAYAPDWPPFKPTQPRHAARTLLTPEPVVPSEDVANAMLGPLTLISHNQAVLTGNCQRSQEHAYIMPIILIISVALNLVTALTCIWGFKGRRRTSTLTRAPLGQTLGTDQVLGSSTCQGPGVTGASSNVKLSKSTKQRGRARAWRQRETV